MELLIQPIKYFIYLFIAAMSIRVILSFAPHFMRPPLPPLLVTIDSIVERITEPVLGPIRRMLPPFGGLDFSPMVVFIVLLAILRVLP